MPMQAVLIICVLTIVSSGFGLLGLWYPLFSVVLFVVLLFAGICLFLYFCKDFLTQLRFGAFHYLLFLMFVFTVFFHSIGILVPETGFDALWYHLPLIQEYSTQHALVHDEQFYQSLYPQYGDGVLLLGYISLGVIGAKLVSFIFFLILSLTVYAWLRRKLSVGDALLGALVVDLFQVVSWQSSSAYVDVISAVFFLWSVEYFFLEKKESGLSIHFFTAALATGVFLGTKFINLGFLPLYVLLSFFHILMKSRDKSVQRQISELILFWLVTVSLALPWYLRSWWFTGSLIYPIGTIYAVPVIAQMGVIGWKEWIMIRVQSIWQLPFEFFFRNDGYVTPLLLLFSLVLLMKKSWSRELFLGTLTGGYGLFFWYFFPPPSTRYVLGPVIVFWIVMYQAIIHFFQKRLVWVRFIRLLCVLNVMMFLLVRVFVTTRSVPYLLHWENQQQYLDRFRNGFLDEKIDAWYSKSAKERTRAL
ncbi:MAG: hypothetical protein ABI425_00170 [Patescibacteria group bacterium]